MSKKTVGIIFGGKSAEHEVSLQSAKNIVGAINRDKYDIVLLGVAKTGKWFLYDPETYLINESNPKEIALTNSNREVAVVPGEASAQIIDLSTQAAINQIDVIFPVVHGTLGEDGSLQGILRTINLPFVGVDLLGSAVSMDKDFAKRILRDAGIPVANGLVFKAYQKQDIIFDQVIEKLGLPVFIKPVNQGSSVGVSKANTENEFYKGIESAFLYDDKILIEEAVIGREIECAVLGNDNPIASLPGEILPQTEFYSYESKYIDENGAILSAPAELSPADTEKVRTTALQVFKVLDCEGLARVDFFLQANGRLVVNEVNTLPGFTKISMYPRLWSLTGVSYPELIDRLIQLAFERYDRKVKLKSVVFE
ncbi:D-alanine--D-alanine ligase [Amphibacillus marinus]|uniref:D-alanine--D-alanine ligase n=1 Tax=Amphibacillus marinus TaxID=872970 RepID=A0A1H8JWM3_9BACI|nr:D-alanine--D-alanine ligase [Amphibacillus marinus]SEN85123.1 D-alanine--D-alanine ligase [Amphibacillus marinus]